MSLMRFLTYMHCGVSASYNTQTPISQNIIKYIFNMAKTMACSYRVVRNLYVCIYRLSHVHNVIIMVAIDQRGRSGGGGGGGGGGQLPPLLWPSTF